MLPLSAINDTDLKRSLFQLQRYCGLARDFAFSLDPTATTDFHIYTLQGFFTEGAQFEAQPLWDTTAQLWRTSLIITEPL